MKDKIKLILLSIIYNELGLRNIEDEFIKNNIPQKEIVSPDGTKPISKYFFLNNDVYLDKLTPEELDFLTNNIDSLEEEKRYQVYNFLDKNKLRLLLPTTKEPYLCWGPMSFEYMAPSDAIVLGFHTLEFIDQDQSKKSERDKYINERINYIQDILAKQADMKVAVIMYNEAIINTFTSTK